MSGGVSRSGAGIGELSVRPRSARTFSFRVANTGDANQHVTVAAACRRVRSGGGKTPYLKLVSHRRTTLRVPASGAKQTTLSCPSGTVPAAAGFELGRGKLSVREETQDLHVLRFQVANPGAAVRSVSVYTGCLTVVRPSGTRPTQLRVSLATDTVPVPSGTQVLTRICAKGWLSLAAGYDLPAGVDLNGAAAVGRTGRWTLTNPAQKPALARLQLACARLT